MKYVNVFLLLIAFIFSSCRDDESNKSTTQGKEYWTCTMHPQVISDKPGSCPICHMELVKRVEAPVNTSDTSMKDMISLSANGLALAGVEIVPVIRKTINQDITSFSYLDFVEANREVISARFSGRIENLFVKNTGDQVTKGSPLFEIYSPALVEAQNEYLLALETGNLAYSLTRNNSVVDSQKFLNASRLKLELLGFSDSQIDNLEKTKEVKYTITYYSKINGIVIEKNIQNGMYVNEGSKLYEIADLSTLWNIAEVFENDLKNIKKGSKAIIELNSFPGETFNGIVTYVYPIINANTRTVQIRSEIRNKGNKLKPSMYGRTTFNIGELEGLFVPDEAVIITGKRNIVWIKTEDGMYQGREVKLGTKYENMYQIVEGLNEGDQVVSKGAYLIDSESQLRTGQPTQHDDNKGNNKPEGGNTHQH